MLVARKDERLLRLGAAFVVHVARQPDRLVAVSPSTLAEERDPVGFGVAAAALAHQLVDLSQERGAALDYAGVWRLCRRRMVGLSRKSAADGRNPASRDRGCLSGQNASLRFANNSASDRILGVGFEAVRQGLWRDLRAGGILGRRAPRV
jgi:hypothetical protein